MWYHGLLSSLRVECNHCEHLLSTFLSLSLALSSSHTPHPLPPPTHYPMLCVHVCVSACMCVCVCVREVRYLHKICQGGRKWLMNCVHLTDIHQSTFFINLLMLAIPSTWSHWAHTRGPQIYQYSKQINMCIHKCTDMRIYQNIKLWITSAHRLFVIMNIDTAKAMNMINC